ncbi:YggS family pyridoxal phosphate-dependent enzyme [Rodentibacter pneumotropicus]|uniref:YggS family pyridoxal phosphate-dependent enzyme n=1 Tax=Rodentibacter pneumotropicus TaxID=758 RepID=UPI00232E8B90|nr:YggS family pyridoxal phosphate-dependent enzyme [Rodentibacter pneumotropicus]MDC2826310.1 YggS family pyridoxal phosphate-dependent enzyme [Rodentibacter pneumotropicus]MDC2826311.1 YggS family pyridoxal phosphate-dependent enzyme [Rodentibacter pneumotropicus]
MNIQHNLRYIQQSIHTACEQTHRPLNAVKLLAVSKTKPVSDILEAYQAGQSAFGENYAQEGVEKIKYFDQQKIKLEWHFIGPLQSNKSRLVAEYFDWMHTLDRVKIAERLNEQRSTNKPPLNVLIQVNISHEESKSGIRPEALFDLAKQIENLPNLHLRGLMAIPAPTENSSEQEKSFKQMAELFEQLKQAFPNQQIDTLSMGMTDDMPSAIKCGSTMVRIGTAIFGARYYSPK